MTRERKARIWNSLLSQLARRYPSWLYLVCRCPISSIRGWRGYWKEPRNANLGKKSRDQGSRAAVAAGRRPRLQSAWQHSGLVEVRNASYNQAMHKHLRRLDRTWLDSQIYFITTMCTKDRDAVPARPRVHWDSDWGMARRTWASLARL